MCEQTSVTYKHEDLVWVKLGPCWWPGEVVDYDKLPDDIKSTLKKQPFAIVKFFQENSYEYVKSINQIYSYNCTKKVEFIKKGLNMYRAKNAFMENFPADVCTAEVRSGGDPNILSDPRFLPEKKIDYSAIFGSPKKEIPKQKKRNDSDSQEFNVTHPRFLGADTDFEIKFLVQNAESKQEPENHYTCSSCSFQTSRVDVMVLHNKAHIEGIVINTPKRKNKSSPNKRKKVAKSEIKKQAVPDEEFDEEPKPKKKAKPVLPKQPRLKKQPKTTEKEKPKLDIKTDLLAEWDDSDADEEEEQSSMDISKQTESTLAFDMDQVMKEKSDNEEALKIESEEKKSEIDDLLSSKNYKSCFDFDEEEDIDVDLMPAAAGRKIPRVIPPSDKRKSNEFETPVEIVESEKKDETLEKNEDTFKDILETTSVPNLPEIPQALKFEQNFHDAKTIKFPDKPSLNSSDTISPTMEQTSEIKKKEANETAKIINPKKRFVKSFEDYELQQNEKKKSENTNNKEVMEETKPLEEQTQFDQTGNNTILLTKNGVSITHEESSVQINQISLDIDNSSETAEQSELVTKLKTQLMSKLQESPEKSLETTNENNETQEVFVSPKYKKGYKRIISESIENDNCKKDTVDKTLEKSKLDEVLLNEKEALLNTVKTCEFSEDINVADETSKVSDTGLKLKDKSHENVNVDETLISLNDDKTNAEKTSLEDIVGGINYEDNSNALIMETTDTMPACADGHNLGNNVETALSPLVTNELETVSLHNHEENNIRESISNEFHEKHDKCELTTETSHVLESNQKENEFTNNLNIEYKDSQGYIIDSSDDVNISNQYNKENTREHANDVLHSENKCFLSNILTESLQSEKEDISALNTLATISELTTTGEVTKDTIKHCKSPAPEKNLTVINEEDLANSQVEITSDVTSQGGTSQPITSSNFSMDFSSYEDESSKESNVKVNSLENNSYSLHDDSKEEKVDISSENIADNQILSEVVQEAIKKSEISESNVENMTCDIEDQIPPLIVCGKSSVESQMAKLTDTNPDMGPLPPQTSQKTTSSRLLDILTDFKAKTENSEVKTQAAKLSLTAQNLTKDDKISKLLEQPDLSSIKTKQDPKQAKFIIKTASKTTGSSSSKPIILSDKLIKPMTESDTVSVQKVSSNKTYEDVEDIDTFIIQKPIKKALTEVNEESLISQTTKRISLSSKPKSKAHIIQQTIITPSGDIIQPALPQPDDFDINSMPIVLSDQILTPESIEKMPIMLSDSSQNVGKATTGKNPGSSNVKILNKTNIPMKEPVLKPVQPSPTIVRTITQKPSKINTRIVQTATALKKGTTVIPNKSAKYILVPSTVATTGTKCAIPKKITSSKQMPILSGTSIGKTQNAETSGSKMLVLTNNHGEQTRIVLTPASNKILAPGGRLVKNTFKAAVPKTIMRSNTSVVAKGANIIGQITSKGQASSSIASTPSLPTTSQIKNIKIEPKIGKKLTLPAQRIYSKSGTNQRATILIKNTPVSTTKRIQSTDDALLEQQVAEQIQAINMASERQQLLSKSQIKIDPNNTKTGKIPVKKSYSRKQIVPGDTSKQMPTLTQKNITATVAGVPALAPLSPAKRIDPASISTAQNQSTTAKTDEVLSSETTKQPKSYLIQDALGNQTPITEGQILAFPSETVDGQPQSYMLVTVDESGNLKPLNNETLMNLDPNLFLGGDLGNTVLQVDHTGEGLAQNTSGTNTQEKTNSVQDKAGLVDVKNEIPGNLDNNSKSSSDVHISEEDKSTVFSTGNGALAGSSANVIAQTSNVDSTNVTSLSSESNQQLFITGDPVATQKLLDTLAEGNSDLANILANAEGNILIQADGQQFLINTGSAENPMLLTLNQNLANVDSNSGNPILGGQPSKNQDILAAALAGTDVFQQDQNIISSQSKVQQSQLSPNNPLYPLNVTNVLETSTMSSPIMTPLEVPSTNSKKIDDETDILSQVPKNVDLPITITDPNISQTVAHQQAASLIAKELQDLPLTISETNISVASSGMNSPSYVYSLPVLDDGVEMNQKAFNASISMPLLSEDTEERIPMETPMPEMKNEESQIILQAQDFSGMPENVADITDKKDSENVNDSKESNDKKSSEPFLGSVSDRLCAMRGGICNSLSEPPPDMFDFPNSQSYDATIEDNKMGTESVALNLSAESTCDSIVSNNTHANEIGNQETIQEHSPDDLDIFDTRKHLTNTLNADLNSPSTNNTDENSCEIPVQPEIVTDLTLTTFENKVLNENNPATEATKRKFTESDDESPQKRCKFD